MWLIQTDMDIKYVARTTIILTTITLVLTTLLSMLLPVRVFLNITPLHLITEVLIAPRLTTLIHTVIMEDTPIILIMTDLMVVFITGMDITGMRITK